MDIMEPRTRSDSSTALNSLLSYACSSPEQSFNQNVSNQAFHDSMGLGIRLIPNRVVSNSRDLVDLNKLFLKRTFIFSNPLNRFPHSLVVILLL